MQPLPNMNYKQPYEQTQQTITLLRREAFMLKNDLWPPP